MGDILAKMVPLKELLINNDDWLMDRLIYYAGRVIDIGDGASVKDAWYRCIHGLSGALVQGLETRFPDFEFKEDEAFKSDPLCSFIVDTAVRHRQRGISLSMFHKLMIYYKEGWLDLVKHADFDPDYQALCLGYVGRMFDRMIIALCEKWTEAEDSELVVELRGGNRDMSREKDRYLTIFEGVPNPVFIIDKDGRIAELNQAALVMINATGSQGAHYYIKTVGASDKQDCFPIGEAIHTMFPWIREDFNTFISGSASSLDLEKEISLATDNLFFNVKFSRIEDLRTQFNDAIIIIEDITEKKRAEKGLRRAKRAAEEANKAKSRFIANMSHEIRTPMNAILGFTELVRAETRDPKICDYLDAVHTSGETLLRLINDILDMSKLDAGKLKLEYAPVFSLERVLSETGRLFKKPLEEKGVALVVEISQDLPEALLLDDLRLRQVLINLIGNAVKFTQKGYIKLSVSSSYPNAVYHSTLDLTICVEDTGIGIAKNQLSTIFETFGQAKGQKYNQFGGAGLGLTITKNLIEMMNGKIKVKSKPGKGSIFSFCLGGVEVASVEAVKQTSVQNFDFKTICFEPATLLITDDIDYNRELLRGYVREYDFVILEAENGREAIRLARKHQPSLILLDMKMPVMDGYEAATRLKNDPDLQNIPIIAITASAMKEDRALISPLCSAYLVKPVSKATLVREMMAILPHRVQGGKNTGAIPEMEALSLAILKQYPSLTQILKDNRNYCLELSDLTAIYKIEAFAERIKKVGQTGQCPSLVTWAQNLYDAAIVFDTMTMERLLNNFIAVTDD